MRWFAVHWPPVDCYHGIGALGQPEFGETMIIRALAVLMASLFWSAAADAAYYHFDFISTNSVGNHFEVSGITQAADVFNALGGSDILSLTGNVIGPGGGAITGLVANPNQPNPSIYPGGLFDNVGYPTKPYVDVLGVLFEANGYTYRLYAASAVANPLLEPLYFLSTDNPNGIMTPGTPGILGTFLVTAVPEASTWAMMLLGFAGIVVFGRSHRFKTAIWA
jgi:hypothetical protein